MAGDSHGAAGGLRRLDPELPLPGQHADPEAQRPHPPAQGGEGHRILEVPETGEPKQLTFLRTEDEEEDEEHDGDDDDDDSAPAEEIPSLPSLGSESGGDGDG